ncbi:P450 reductase [Seminavis robusta]|uniref:Methionine synthase reductase n=1 Tax=Seminavis robusta TaxID=568900 RepID=A0A9N8D5W5_9STRA|nr:P450 reductase [Seminavis robusta]|eukprot:Sro13_g009990.1 P450 reductase (1048) ;mRNA; r:82347-85590
MSTLYILYGSATGNAEYIAKDLAAKGPPAPFQSVVCEALEKFKKHADSVWSKPPPSGMRKHGLVIVCSTTGNGDAPENASRFARYVKRKTTIEAKAFQHVCYAVLGLGDTNYDIFCGAAKALDKKLEEAGGERIKRVACADEATGLEEGVEPWTASILEEITKACFSSSSSNNSNKIKEEKSNDPVSTTQQVTTEPPKEEEIVKTPKLAKEAPKPNPTSKPKTLNKNVKSESPLFILYGSATGNAEQIAKDLAATYNMFLSNPDAFTYFPSVVCCDLNGWRKNCLPIWEKAPANGGKHGVLVVTSTTGNADPPENSDRFARWIKRKQTIAAAPLQHSAFSVLGLGDTNYDVFCAIGKAVDKQLEVLGGSRAKPLVCADEATGLEEVVDPWVASILLEISLACQPDSSATSGNDENVPPENTSNSTPKESSSEIQEEKKMDSSADLKQQSAVVVSSSTGVRTLCSILNLDCKCPLEEVNTSCLPKIGTSMSSCALLSHLEEEQILQAASADDDRVTVSSASSSAIHYTLQKPFESTICNARYLTTTPTDAAQKAAGILSASASADASLIQQAADVYTELFPLTVSDSVSADNVERNGKRVIELTLTLPDDFTLEYTPGDSLGLIVENPPVAVDFVLGMLKQHQGILPDQRVSIDKGNPMTVREAISREVDLSSPLKSKRILSNLSQHATDCEDRKALQLLASKTPEGEKAFECFVDQQRLSVVDILQEFPSCQCIPLTALLGILPGIPPRYYSVSSSPLASQQELSLTVSFSVVDYVTPSLLSVDQAERGLRRKKGIATSHLEVLSSSFLAGGSAGAAPMTVKIFPKPTADFRMPASLATPMVLIGPGTGIAPFMGFLQHRRAMLSNMESKEAASSVVEGTWRGGFEMEEDDLKISKGDASGLSVGADFMRKNQSVGSVDVFFGCRHQDHDWLYRSDMQDLKADGTIASLYTAFSRDTNGSSNGHKRKYVQDIMLHDTDCSARLRSLILEKKASVFICGDGNAMAKDVQSALTQIIGEGLDGSDEKAAKLYVEKMKKDKRYLVDIWTS